MESKYLARFQKAGGKLPLRGNRLLVEVMPKEELKSAGGLILNAPTSDHRSKLEQERAKLAVVVAIGNGYFDGEEDVPLDIKPGAVVLISELGLKYYSEFPGIAEYTGETLALTRDTEVHAAWDSLEAYQEYRTLLNHT